MTDRDRDEFAEVREALDSGFASVAPLWLEEQLAAVLTAHDALAARVRELEADLKATTGIDYGLARNSDAPPQEVNRGSLLGQRDRALARVRELGDLLEERISSHRRSLARAIGQLTASQARVAELEAAAVRGQAEVQNLRAWLGYIAEECAMSSGGILAQAALLGEEPPR